MKNPYSNGVLRIFWLVRTWRQRKQSQRNRSEGAKVGWQRRKVREALLAVGPKEGQP